MIEVDADADVTRRLAFRAREYLHNHPCTEATGVPCPDEEELREALEAFFASQPP